MAQKKTLDEMERFLAMLGYDIDEMKEDWEWEIEEDKEVGIKPPTWEKYVKLRYKDETNWF